MIVVCMLEAKLDASPDGAPENTEGPLARALSSMKTTSQRRSHYRSYSARWSSSNSRAASVGRYWTASVWSSSRDLQKTTGAGVTAPVGRLESSDGEGRRVESH